MHNRIKRRRSIRFELNQKDEIESLKHLDQDRYSIKRRDGKNMGERHRNLLNGMTNYYDLDVTDPSFHFTQETKRACLRFD